jgi:hypothetical protein
MKVIPVLLAFEIFQAALPLGDGFILTSEEEHLVYYIRDIVYQQFEAGRSILFSWPSYAYKKTHTQHTLAPKPPNADRMNIVYFLLTSLNHITRWPIHISCVGAQSPEIIFDTFGKHHGHVIFTWAEEKEVDVIGHLIDQLEEMKNSPLWNSRGRFLIVVIGHRSQNISRLALDIAEELWNQYKISNVLLLIPKVGTKFLQSTQPQSKNNIPLSFGLYTWIPYQSHNTCEKINVFLVEEWPHEGKQTLLQKEPLLSDKIPKQLHGCPLRVSIIDTPPALVVLNNTGHIHTGVEVQYIQQLAQAANATIMYLKVLSGDPVTVRFNSLADLEAGRADLTLGGYPLHPVPAALADPTISHLDDTLIWYVPCGMPNDITVRVMAIFTPSLSMAICGVFVLVVVVIWRVVNITRFTQLHHSHTSTSILSSISKTSAVMLGISVPGIPRNDTFRTVFLAVVWYSSAISCVFQTYFTSILVNPGMNKQITTLEELYQSSFVYRYNNGSDSFVNITDPSYYSKICLRREECLYRGYCIIDYLNNLNVAIISSRFHAEYYTLAALPPGSSTPRMCTLQDSFYSIRYTIYIGKGSFLVDTFNRIIHHVTEAGLIDKLMRDAKTSWRYEDVLYNQLATDEVFRMNNETVAYIVFSMSHLKVAFYFLALGYLLSTIIITAELLFSRYIQHE